MAIGLRGARRIDLQDAAEGDEGEEERAVARLLSDFACVLEFEPDGPHGCWTSGGLTRVTGYSLAEVNGIGWLEIVLEEDRAKLVAAWQRARAGQGDTVEVRVATKSGRTRWFRQSMAPMRSNGISDCDRILVAVQDITESRLAEEHCQQADRLAALGILAAGVAHRLNNPLHGLMLCATAAQQARQQGDDELLDSCLQRLQQEVMRCGQVVHSLIQFAGAGQSPYWPCDPRQLLQQACHVMESLAERRGVSLELEHSAELPWLQGNPFELQYVLAQLIGNAVEASPQGRSVRMAAFRLGDWVRLVVKDCGCGMDEEQLRRACDPFFTTHKAQGCLGMGLSRCYSIVRQHGGKLSLESHPGTGTRVTVDLPVPP